MDTTLATPLLGGLSPATFMHRHWQKKPLLVRQAVPGGLVLATRAQLFKLAVSENVESRLITHDSGRWALRHGPLNRAAIPSLKQRQWTLLVQGLDLHLTAARALLDRFRFVPDARLDDVMLSFATDGGGVGPHVDSYDVFLLQVQGRRRWRIGKNRHPQRVPDVPLKILANFQADQEWLLNPGDMLYLPPGWAHDGVAEGECLTCSIGFRAAGGTEIGRDVLQRMLDAVEIPEVEARYRDPRQAATSEPARIPAALQAFAAGAVVRALADSNSLECALGEVLTEPKRGVGFNSGGIGNATESVGVNLDTCTRMMYDDRHVFINGESFRTAGRDARLVRRLADRRELNSDEMAALSHEARQLFDDWLAAGWLRPTAPTGKRGDKE